MLFSKKKTQEEPVKTLTAFVSGKVIPITEVNDQVFSAKVLGNGVAIQPDAQIITAPCDGVISMADEDSKHAIGMTLNNGVELLLHIGIDTVSLNGEGFRVFAKKNAKVKRGDKLLEFDKEFIESKKFQGKGVYGAVAVGKISIFKKADAEVKRVHVVDTDNKKTRFEQAKSLAVEQLQEIYDKAAKGSRRG